MMPSPEFLKRAKDLMPQLLKRINAQGSPITIPILPEQDAVINSCFYNVQRKVNKHGGRPVYGWALRLTQHILEAEKHAIWLSPTNEYIDITPASHVETYTAFVADNEFIYEGQLVDNVRLNMTDNKVVDDLIAVNETIGKAWASGKRTGEQQVSLANVFTDLIEDLEKFSSSLNRFIDNGGDYTSPCFCGSGRNYNDCHGHGLRQGLDGLWSKTTAIVRNANIKESQKQ